MSNETRLMLSNRYTCNVDLFDYNILLILLSNIVAYFQTPHPLYRPSNDLVPCRHALCASLHHNDNYDCEVPHQCDYEVEYADHYSSLGVLLHDVYTLNFTNGVQLKVRMALGLVSYLKPILVPLFTL